MELPESDAVLASRAGEGDRHAFDQLVTRHKGGLYRLARTYIGNSDDAYDIVQESFVSTWLAIRRYDPSKDFGVWLRTIALNKCRDFGRRRTVRRRFLRLFAAEQSIESAVTPAGTVSDDRKARRLASLDAAIASLPPFYKEPLLLTIVSGLSQQAVAAQLKTTTKAIELRIRRAKKKLGQELKERPGEG